MVLTVETGTGLSDANAYISSSFADTYLTDRSILGDWLTATTASKEAAIILATEYLDATYSWIGKVKVTTQALGWPRTNAYDAEGRTLAGSVPLGVQRACAELAVKSLSESLLADTTSEDHIKREKLDVMDSEYMASAPTGNDYNYVSRLLKGLFISASGSNQAKLLRS